jgi:hypothetical protein
VSNATDLANALSGSSARDIILENGVYDKGSYYSVNAGHRLWAATLGGATVKSGLKIDNASGVEVHGVKFDVDSSSKTGAMGATIYTGENANRLTVTDSWFEGHMQTHAAIYLQGPDGPKLSRLVIAHFQGEGIRIQGPKRAANPPPYISDIDVSYIKHPTKHDGTTEFAIALGNSAPGGMVERIRCHHVNWSCLIAFRRSTGTTWRDWDVDYDDIPFYFEHYGDNNIIERFHIGPHAMGGIIFEGALPNWRWLPTGKNHTIRNGVIESDRWGIAISQCEGPITVDHVVFRNQCLGAILDNTNMPYADGHCEPPAGTKFTNNDYSGIDAGAKAIAVNQSHFQGNLCD